MPAQTKNALLAVGADEFQRLIQIIADISSAQALAKDADGVSIKDIIAHRAHWITLFLKWYADGQAGRPVHTPAKGYKWNELPRFNADLRAAQEGLSWMSAKTALTDAHTVWLALVSSLREDDLYGAPMKGAHNDWTTGRWAEAAAPSHYRSATKYIRARLKLGV